MKKAIMLFTLVFLFPPVVSLAIPTPTAFWSFDSYSGTGNVYDDYGNYPLAPRNNASYRASEGVGGTGTFYFDGYSDRLEDTFNADSLMPKGNKITISAWFNVTSTANHQINPFQHPIALWGGYHLRIHENQKQIGFAIFTPNENDVYYNSADPLWNFNEWHHMAGVYDGSAMKLYFDGTLVAEKTGTWTLNTHTGYNLMLGAVSWSCCVEELHGYVDNVGIWQEALSGDEIKELYGNKPVPEPATLTLYAMGLVPWLWRQRKRNKD